MERIAWEMCQHNWSDVSIYSKDGEIAKLSIAETATEENEEELRAKMLANAKLIEAAPDLLKAAQDIRRLLYELGADDGDVLVGALSQAIAKATT